MKVRPRDLYFFPNGNAAVCDQFGKQMPRYQTGGHREAIARLAEDGIDWRQLPAVYGVPIPGPGAFLCAMCGRIEDRSPDGVAETEAATRGIDPRESGLVCDACFGLTPWGSPPGTN